MNPATSTPSYTHLPLSQATGTRASEPEERPPTPGQTLQSQVSGRLDELQARFDTLRTAVRHGQSLEATQLLMLALDGCDRAESELDKLAAMPGRDAAEVERLRGKLRMLRQDFANQLVRSVESDPAALPGTLLAAGIRLKAALEDWEGAREDLSRLRAAPFTSPALYIGAATHFVAAQRASLGAAVTPGTSKAWLDHVKTLTTIGTRESLTEAASLLANILHSDPTPEVAKHAQQLAAAWLRLGDLTAAVQLQGDLQIQLDIPAAFASAAASCNSQIEASALGAAALEARKLGFTIAPSRLAATGSPPADLVHEVRDILPRVARALIERGGDPNAIHARWFHLVVSLAPHLEPGDRQAIAVELQKLRQARSSKQKDESEANPDAAQGEAPLPEMLELAVLSAGDDVRSAESLSKTFEQLMTAFDNRDVHQSREALRALSCHPECPGDVRADMADRFLKMLIVVINAEPDPAKRGALMAQREIDHAEFGSNEEAEMLAQRVHIVEDDENASQAQRQHAAELRAALERGGYTGAEPGLLQGVERELAALGLDAACGVTDRMTTRLEVLATKIFRFACTREAQTPEGTAAVRAALKGMVVLLAAAPPALFETLCRKVSLRTTGANLLWQCLALQAWAQRVPAAAGADPAPSPTFLDVAVGAASAPNAQLNNLMALVYANVRHVLGNAAQSNADEMALLFTKFVDLFGHTAAPARVWPKEVEPTGRCLAFIAQRLLAGQWQGTHPAWWTPGLAKPVEDGMQSGDQKLAVYSRAVTLLIALNNNPGVDAGPALRVAIALATLAAADDEQLAHLKRVVSPTLRQVLL